MKPSSAKAKGRRAVAELRELLLDAAPELKPGDIEVKATSVPGEDLWFSPAAKAVYPFTWEVKNCEKLNVWQALEQAASHCKGLNPFPPALAFRRNRSEMFVAFRLRDWVKWLNKPSK